MFDIDYEVRDITEFKRSGEYIERDESHVEVEVRMCGLSYKVKGRKEHADDLLKMAMGKMKEIAKACIKCDVEL